jgi:serine/threonine protein kinase
MQTNERLMELLERWAEEADAGRLLSASDLCRDCVDLLPEAQRQIAMLGQFHLLARPEMATAVAGEAQRQTKDSEPTLATSGVALPDTGARFGRYEILAELGKGGMGIVYEARDTQLGRDVALKVMSPEVAARPNTSERFLREARALAAVRHDHVVEIYDYGERDGMPFVTMPLLSGETLETRLAQHSPLPPAEVVRIGTELAEGLAAVHDKGLIHRDLKPSNVWLEAPSSRVKLLDFGLARDPQADDGVTNFGSVAGTPAYMSPEQVNGMNLDARTDLFSLGSVLYKAATGRPAFAAATMSAILAAVGEKDPVPARTVNPAIPARLADLIDRLHQKNPANRPASATEVVKELRGLVVGPEAPTTDWRSGRFQDTLRQGEPNRVRPEGQGVTRGALLRIHRQAWSYRVRLAVASMLGLLLVLGTVLFHYIHYNMSWHAEVASDVLSARSEQPDPKDAEAHYNLAKPAKDKLDLDALAWDALGQTLLRQGHYAEARDATRSALALLPSGHPQQRLAVQQLQSCEQYLVLDGKLPAILQGEATPANASEAVALAQMCQQHKKRHAAAARLYADAFAAEWKLFPVLQQQHRYNAACSATLAAAGQGEDARRLPDKVAGMFRRWAIGWLRDDVTAYAKLAEQNNPAANKDIQQRLAHWRSDADLTSVRDEAALERLPQGERDAWRALWRDVDDLAARLAKKDN